MTGQELLCYLGQKLAAEGKQQVVIRLFVPDLFENFTQFPDLGIPIQGACSVVHFSTRSRTMSTLFRSSPIQQCFQLFRQPTLWLCCGESGQTCQIPDVFHPGKRYEACSNEDFPEPE